MTTTTTPAPATDWYTTEFAAITATPYPSIDRPTYATTGHSTEACPAINGERIPATSLAAYAEANEYWDGEVEYLIPWPCGTCVSVKGTPTTIGFTDPVLTYGTGTGAPRPEVQADPQAAADLAEATEYARTYAGAFPFMVDMREKARRHGTFSPKMVAAILRCKTADARRATPQAAPEAPQGDEDARRAALAPNAYAGSCRACNGSVAPQAGRREKVEGRWTVLHATTAECAATPAAPVAAPAEAPGFDLRTLPAAARGALHVAVPDHTTGQIVFLKIAQRDGKVVALQEVGGHEDLYLGTQWDGKAYRGKRAAELAAVVADPQAAAIAYGLHFTRCGICGTQLTDTDPGGSVERGIGPDCAARLGW
jgi:hypothetical protein